MKKMFIIFSLLISSLTFGAAGTHGFVLFGNNQHFAYHLPMFHKMHAKQLIFDFSLDENTNELLKKYPNQLLTFVPTPFDLEAFSKAPFALKGELYLGHFEKDGELIASEVILNPILILYNQDIALTQKNKYKYFLIGDTFDLYAIHIIDDQFKMDQILNVQNLDLWNLDSTLAISKAIEKKSIINLNSPLKIEDQFKIGIYDPGPCTRRICSSIKYIETNLKVSSIFFQGEVI